MARGGTPVEAPHSALNNLSTHHANKPSVYDPVDKMTSDSRQIESDHKLSLCQQKVVADRVKSL